MTLANFMQVLLRIYEHQPDNHPLAIGHSVPVGLFRHRLEPDISINVGDIRRWVREATH